MDRAMTASALSSSIAHELKQPLGAILSNAEAVEMLLDANALDRSQLKEIIADIRADDGRAVEVLKHLGALLKQSESEVREFELIEALNNAVKILAPQARAKGVTLQVETMPPNLRILADPVHLQQVLLNLALNGFDAMQGTPLKERRLMLRVSRGDHHALVSIEDTGTGISDDKIKRIFDPFVTTKQEGTGLGLSIVRTIIDMYGGRIWAENRAEGGAAFRFILPLAPT
jgi:signal transduction histidine kinase